MWLIARAAMQRRNQNGSSERYVIVWKSEKIYPKEKRKSFSRFDYMLMN